MRECECLYMNECRMYGRGGTLDVTDDGDDDDVIVDLQPFLIVPKVDLVLFVCSVAASVLMVVNV